MLLDRFGQLNKFWKKSLKYFEHPSEYSEGNLRDVMRKSWGRPESTSQGLPWRSDKDVPLKVRLGRPLDVIQWRPLDVTLRRPQDVRSGRPPDGPTGSLGYVLGTLEGHARDVLGTNLCQLGNLTANLKRAENTRFYFILEEAKETAFEFSQGTVKVL